ncbi:hypothetical protein C8R44DRAFT_738293 [Mycena epipterygia]|nr:hypothetical protein C8R44DRAFT_738293 [Mycena epipterygia]
MSKQAMHGNATRSRARLQPHLDGHVAFHLSACHQLAFRLGSSMTADDPRSAPELEQIILELCAADRPAGMLVAQRVKECTRKSASMWKLPSVAHLPYFATSVLGRVINRAQLPSCPTQGKRPPIDLAATELRPSDNTGTRPQNRVFREHTDSNLEAEKPTNLCGSHHILHLNFRNPVSASSEINQVFSITRTLGFSSHVFLRLLIFARSWYLWEFNVEASGVHTSAALNPYSDRARHINYTQRACTEEE